MIVKIVIGLALLTILASLGSALFYLVKDQERTERTAKALTTRITLSIALFIFLLVAFASGVIQPHGLNPNTPASTSQDFSPE